VASTTPNKEVVRRICHLHGATKCYLFVETNDKFVEVLTNITSESVESCQNELKSWAGMKFRLFTFNESKNMTDAFIAKSDQILPIIL